MDQEEVMGMGNHTIPRLAVRVAVWFLATGATTASLGLLIYLALRLTWLLMDGLFIILLLGTAVLAYESYTRLYRHSHELGNEIWRSLSKR
jgi:hypothetical protein